MIPVAKVLSADTITPVGAYLRLRRKGVPSFLLESADGGESVGRYSFLGCEPSGSLVAHHGKLTIRDGQDSESIEVNDPIKEIGKVLERYTSKNPPHLPPFQGGAIGYVGYDAVHYLEEIPRPDKDFLTPDASLMFFRSIVAFDRLKHQIFLISHVEPAKESLKDGLRRALGDIEDLESKIRSPLETPGLPLSMDISDGSSLKVRPMMGRQRYLEGVKTIKNHIRAGDIFQCVLSDRFELDLKGDPFTTYRYLRMINPSPYLYYLDFGDQILLGSSPEMLVRAEGKTIETCPIAGTRPRGKDRKEDLKYERELLQSVKEKAEHLMLVDLGRNDIGRVSRSGTVEVTDYMSVERFSHVMHLVSLVRGKLKSNLSAWDALCSCFPAGTLTGAPKIRAMEIISSLEGAARGCYGGAVVAHDFSGNLNSCITIRSMWVKEGRGYIQAGAGVVADSNPEKEYEEVLNKSKAVRVAASLAEKSGGGR